MFLINNKYEMKVHRTFNITNIHIKPTSCIDPNIIKRVFRDFLHRSHSISFEKYIKEEEKLLIGMFFESGHNIQLLRNSTIIQHNNKKNNKSNHESNTKNRDYTNLIKLPSIPNISPTINKTLVHKIGKDIALMSVKNLQ